MDQEMQTAAEELSRPAEEIVLSLKRNRRHNRLGSFCMEIMSGGGGVLVYEAISSLHTKHAEFVVATPYLAFGAGALALQGLVYAKKARQQTQAIHELEPKVDRVRAGENPLSTVFSAAVALIPQDSFLYKQYLKFSQPSPSENA